MAATGVLAPLIVLGVGAGEADDGGALDRGGAFAGLPELVLLIPVVIIGGRGTEVLFGRF